MKFFNIAIVSKKELEDKDKTIKELTGLLRDVLENIYVPEARCTCFISPPCNDCVEYSYIRELVSSAEAYIRRMNPEGKSHE